MTTNTDDQPTNDSIANTLAGQATIPSGADVSMPDAPEPKKRGRPKGSTSAKKTTKKQEDKAKSFTAAQINATGLSVMASIFGDEIIPDEGDQKNLNTALAAYLDTKEDFDIPPGIALVLAYTVVFAPRFAQPTVRTRFVNMGIKIKGAFSRVKNIFKKKGK